MRFEIGFIRKEFCQYCRFYDNLLKNNWNYHMINDCHADFEVLKQILTKDLVLWIVEEWTNVPWNLILLILTKLEEVAKLFQVYVR